MRRITSIAGGYALVGVMGLLVSCAALGPVAPPEPMAPLTASVADSLIADLARRGHEDLSERLSYLGEFDPSFYQIIDETAYPPEELPSVPILDRDGGVIANVSSEYLQRLRIEGCGRLRDGRVVTFDLRVDGETRFRLTDAPFGLSHADTPLVPFRTVAVDTQRIALGTLLYLPDVVGIELPDGTPTYRHAQQGDTRHDGVLIAEDIGSAIREERIDLFVGAEDHIHNRLTVNGRMKHGRRVRLYRIEGPLAATLARRFVNAQNALLP